ncbi:ribonuclease H-like domain-containing protein [Butyrivibrio sp. FCS006]|uniref:ribonuclease H-like domain-containing protein n=1 Tax=Butyrivibrio sp. FCS006 TaxID=1280684 RepID=UPI0004097FC1|nr:ribonuclease H-like domain-containing protein [Butyrivibrio sp. FCS006]
MKKTSEIIEGISSDALEMLPEIVGCSKEGILFIDIETTGLSPRNSDLYMIGTGFWENGKWVIRQFFGENAQEEEKVLSEFSDFSRSFTKVVHFNGDRFDIPFLQSKYEEHKLTDPFGRLESFDLYKWVKPYKKQLGLPDCKQKTIERFLKIDREDEYDGGKLIAVYKDYEESKSSELLQLLLLHNFEDVKGMMRMAPILLYGRFFKMFDNLPKVSVRTDEEINEQDYITDELPVKAVKVQANKYKDLDRTEKMEVFMKLVLPIELPTSISGNVDGCFFKTSGREATLRVPLYEMELKYFYSNYKDYYYLPQEDMAIHKSLATFVDKDFREKAKPENCYTKKQGQYLMEWDLVFAPFFKRDYEDKSFFFDLNENMKKSRFAMSLYACHVIAYILGIY